eukprot:768056-Hanusia_phi.AAC.14
MEVGRATQTGESSRAARSHGLTGESDPGDDPAGSRGGPEWPGPLPGDRTVIGLPTGCGTRRSGNLGRTP